LPRMVFSRRKTTTELLDFELLDFELSAYLSVLTVKSEGLVMMMMMMMMMVVKVRDVPSEQGISSGHWEEKTGCVSCLS
jgi:hypothetical protein